MGRKAKVIGAVAFSMLESLLLSAAVVGVSFLVMLMSPQAGSLLMLVSCCALMLRAYRQGFALYRVTCVLATGAVAGWFLLPLAMPTSVSLALLAGGVAAGLLVGLLLGRWQGVSVRNGRACAKCTWPYIVTNYFALRGAVRAPAHAYAPSPQSALPAIHPMLLLILAATAALLASPKNVRGENALEVASKVLNASDLGPGWGDRVPTPEQTKRELAKLKRIYPKECPGLPLPLDLGMHVFSFGKGGRSDGKGILGLVYLVSPDVAASVYRAKYKRKAEWLQQNSKRFVPVSNCGSACALYMWSGAASVLMAHGNWYVELQLDLPGPSGSFATDAARKRAEAEHARQTQQKAVELIRRVDSRLSRIRSTGPGAETVGPGAQPPPAEERKVVGKVESASGEVFVGRTLEQAISRSVPLRKGEEIRAGDFIDTGKNGWVNLVFVIDVELSISPDSTISISRHLAKLEEKRNRREPFSLFKLINGYVGMVCHFITYGSKESFKIRLKLSAFDSNAGLRGTELIVGADPELGKDTWMVREGKVEVSCRTGSTLVCAGQQVEVTKGVLGPVQPLDEATWAALSRGMPGPTRAAKTPPAPPQPARPPAQPGAVGPTPRVSGEAIVIEGEAMRLLARTGGRSGPQDMRTFPGRWSGDHQLFWIEGRPGDTLQVALPVRTAGRYRLLLQFTRAPDYAIVQLYLAGRRLRGPLDLYHTEVVAARPVDLGVHDLPAGEHKLAIHIDGANAKAEKKYLVGLDRAFLVPVAE